MRTFPETGYPGVWSKQTILVGVEGGGGRESGAGLSHTAILPLCIVYIIHIIHSTLFCVRGLKRVFLFSTLFASIPVPDIVVGWVPARIYSLRGHVRFTASVHRLYTDTLHVTSCNKCTALGGDHNKESFPV